MANTIMTAKNTFSEGLIMDMAPDNTLTNTLTSALNATLLTFNGNEMSLQNDMGNGRVETAFLPQGYVPLGTCEFGDIIYIVSYNPLTNKSLIGCFPSPERNISSEEISDITLVITSKDFQEIKENGIPTGKLKATSIKKILLNSKELSPGDKFIIYGINNALQDNNNKLSDYGNNNHTHNDFPKLLKLHVISIDDSGKITYLDSSSKWYDSNHYYFQDLVKTIKEKPNIDSYRTLVSSAYLIFQSKNSGKLAVLAELEKIKSFNCAYSIIPIVDKEDKNKTNCHVYLHSSWTNDNSNINPTGLAIIKSEWVGNTKGKYRIPLYSTDHKLYEYIDSEKFIKLPVDPSYNLLIEFTNYYHLDSEGNYKEFVSDPTVELQEAHKISYNKYLTDTYTGTNGNNFPKVSRIVPAKDNNIYTIGTYYLNLDEIEYKSDVEKIYKSKDNNGILQAISALSISDDIINNYYNRDVIKELATVELPMYTLMNTTKAPNDLKNLVWAITVAPCMPYGVLEEYAIDMVIDFNTVTKDDIILNNWRYWNLGESLTLTYGLDIKLTNNLQVKDVTLEFYDNLGLVATYIDNNKSSYSGLFTEQFGLEGSGTNYKLLKIDYNGTPIIHAGLPYTEKWEEGLVTLDDNKPEKATNISKSLYNNDAGTLYPNFLYRVLIKIHYGYKDELDNFIGGISTKTYARWFWTNSMFNKYYHNVNNFDLLPLELGLSAQYKILSNANYMLNKVIYTNPDMSPDSDNILRNSLGASVTYINLDDKQSNNLNLKLTNIGLSESYNTLFFLLGNETKISVDVSLGYKYINIDDITYTPSIESDSMNFLKPQIDSNLNISNGKLEATTIGNRLKELIKYTETITNGKELWEDPKDGDPVNNYINTFSIKLDSNTSNKVITQLNTETSIDTIKNTYEDSEGYIREITETINTNGNNIKNKGINLTLTGISFTKLCFLNSENISGQYPVIKSLVRSRRNRDMLDLNYDTTANTFYFNRMLGFAIEYEKDGKGAISTRACSSATKSSPTTDDVILLEDGNYAYNSDSVLQAIENEGFNSPLILICWCRAHGEDRMYFEHASIDSKFGTFYPYNKSNPLGPSLNTKEDTNIESYLLQLALYQPQKGLYILNDVIPKSSTSKLDVSLNVTKVNTNGQKAEDTQANLIVSMLSLLYCNSGEYETYSKKKFGTLCSPNTYNEIWGLHILVTMKGTGISSEYVGLSNGMSISEYIKTIKEVSSNNDITSKDNCVTPIILDSQMLIDFKYSIPKNDQFKAFYEDKSLKINSIIYLSNKKEPIVSSETFPDEELYYINNLGMFQPLVSTFTYQPCEFKSLDGETVTNLSDEILAIKKDKSNVITIDNLGKMIEFDKNRLFKIRQYPFTNLYKITIGKESTNKNDWVTGLSTDAKFTGVWDLFLYKK